MDATVTVEQLAEVLREPHGPLLRQVLQTCGQERTTAIVTKTLTCEVKGGMVTKNGTRRRTPGGVFFQLVTARTTLHDLGIGLCIPREECGRPLWGGLHSSATPS